MRTVLSSIFAFLSSMTPGLGALFIGSTSAVATYQWTNDQMEKVIARLDALTSTSFGGTLNVSPFGLLNTFVPLQESMTFFASFIAVLALCAAVRIAKSFVPTVAS